MPTVKPDHAAVKVYYATLQNYAKLKATHEGATETAFSHLLAVTGKSHKWDLIPKQPVKLAGNKSVIPDGTLRDEFNLPRGYWEAKDTSDDLDAEITKKIAKKYPLINTIFEDTTRAVLYQNGKEHARYDLTIPQQLADLLNQFFAFTEPNIEGFEQAISEFKERVPELAKGLSDKIKLAHKENKKFQAAFDEFFELCKTALNPNIRVEAVDEMLIQHLLTERLFRKIFHDDEFTSRNVIAAEVERVIAALVSKSFSRTEFLKSLDKFYKAIELAAESIDDFTQKQHFLNTVYERFFQGYSVKTADTHGIVYTPQPIVDFMCASVEEVLKTEFGLTLGSKDVNILDPCTGTGNFIVNLLKRIPKKDLPRVYKEQLFANEVMLMPYYIAALNIEHEYRELTGEYESFEGLCFVDTLELAEEKPHLFSGMNEKNTERVERQKKTPITVVIGNPPYNVGQDNENDNNKNRPYLVIDERIRETYVKDSSAKLHTKLYDAYIRFFRWSIDRLNSGPGIICFISNNGFITKQVYSGMRRHLLQEFNQIYHFDCLGDAHTTGTQRKRQGGNVFDNLIRVGVGVTILIKSNLNRKSKVNYFCVTESASSDEKIRELQKFTTHLAVPWTELNTSSSDWFPPNNESEYAQFAPICSKQTSVNMLVQPIFSTYSLGVSTNRDEVVYDYNFDSLQSRVRTFCEDYNSEVDRASRKGNIKDLDAFLNTDKIKWSSTLKKVLVNRTHIGFNVNRIKEAVYRPFTKMWLYYDSYMCDRPGHFSNYFKDFPKEGSSDNVVLVISGKEWRTSAPSALCTNAIPDLHLCAASDGHDCFPFYTYTDAGERRENITNWSLNQFQKHYSNSKVSKWDIFYYVYSILHHPGYRTKFADNLKRELPRIPFAPDFWSFAKAGKKLAEWHLKYEEIDPYPLREQYTDGVPLSYVVSDKMKLSKDKTSLRVNESLTLTGIPPEVFEYRLGNRSALEWVIDQYRVTEDPRSGIRSDPNREDDPEYIVRLVGQVVKVSLETVKLVNGLPEKYSDSA